MIDDSSTVDQPFKISPALQLIGEVVFSHLRDRYFAFSDSAQTDRYILHQLDPETVSAIAYTISLDKAFEDFIDIKLPYHFVSKYVADYQLRDNILTLERATYWRNAACNKAILLLANTGDDEAQSLNLLTPISSQFIKSLVKTWISVVSNGIDLSVDDRRIWERALEGLHTISFVTLDRFAKYVVATRNYIAIEGFPVIRALGAALPALQLPRSSNFFEAIPDKKRTQPSQWRSRYEEIYKKRAPYLRKYTPTQSLLSQEELRSSFEKTKEDILQEHHVIIEEFIKSPSGWSSIVDNVANIEWDDIEVLFEGVKREKVNLGRLTLDFFADKEPLELLSKDEKDYLERLAKHNFKLDDEGRNFYELHRNELKEHVKIKSLWDRYVFGSPLEADDFLTGFALSLERLFARNEDEAVRQLVIEPDLRSKSDLEKLNEEAGSYFATRYKGLDKLCGRQVSWVQNKLFDFPTIVKEWKDKKRGKYVPNRSVAKRALQIRFSFTMHVNYADGRIETYTSQLIWHYNPNYVTNEFTEDWGRLIDHPLVFCSATREISGAKGKQQAVNLRDVKTLVPVYGRSRGSFVASYKNDHDIAHYIEKQLLELEKKDLVEPAIVNGIRKLWTKFTGTYREAINSFAEQGLATDSLLQQAEDWAALLKFICRSAKGDWIRFNLLRPLLQIGSVSLLGEPLVEIIAPWHPMRMLAMGVKARYVGTLVNRFLTENVIRFGESRLFFRDLAEDLSHPFYPEVALAWGDGSRPHLLSLTDTCGDYSLHELPRANEVNIEETGENPTDAANCITDLVKRYISLHPHERANLSVVLYNCDSARLPQAVVDKLGAFYEEDEEVCCQVQLRHQTPQKLGQLYQRIIESTDTNVDAYNASESTRDFMARLRISISVEQASAPTPEDGCPNDIVFSQDVISRHAQIKFFPEKTHTLPVLELLPARWSRRRPGAKDDMKSIVYLCCPVQTDIGWSYLTAMTTFLEGDWNGNDEYRLLPARQLDFQDSKMRAILEETHNLGDWVVNYDELLDRRQLINQKVRVIRYKQLANQGRNLVISSNAPTGLLHSMVRNRLQSLGLNLSTQDEKQLSQRFIDEANDVSGDIVLRAAKRGRNASELIGVVLSRYIIKYELGQDQQIGWYFLDDYADWLGQREQQIADILALSPKLDENGNFLLSIIVSESKYIDYSGLQGSKKTSAKQLRDTVKRIEEALFGIPMRFDREAWLSRISDLLVDGVQFPSNAPITLSDWRQAIRNGQCGIAIRGYSHVFVSSNSGTQATSEAIKLDDFENGFQEVFDREALRQLVLAFRENRDPADLRNLNVDFPDWKDDVFKIIEDGDLIDYKKEQKNKVYHAAASKPGMDTELGSGNSLNEESLIKVNLPINEFTLSKNIISSKWAYANIENLVNTHHIDKKADDDNIWLKTVENRCKSALQGFGLQAKLLSSSLTPNTALLRFQGSANLTVDQVNRKITEFKTTHGLAVVSVQAGLGSVILAIERPARQVVSIETVWRLWAEQAASHLEVPIAIREDNGEVLTLSLQRNAPHTLIAGSTGSGKSVLLQNIILSIAATNTPNEAQIILIDPKLGVDYFTLESIPHLTHGIIDDQDIALDVLKNLIEEMNRRYQRFRETRTSNLVSFNSKVSQEERFPIIWVIHDEFAEWMMIEEYKQQVTSIVSRLGVKARAAGIHLVFAAQRPDANVMPMQLRANLGNRLILRVDSEGTSELALGEKGAERLLGRGHLLAKLEGEPALVYAQVPFVSDDFLNNFLALFS